MKNIKILIILTIFSISIHTLKGAAPSRSAGAVIQRGAAYPATQLLQAGPTKPSLPAASVSAATATRFKSKSPGALLTSSQQRERLGRQEYDESDVRLDRALENLGKDRNSTSFEILGVQSDASRTDIMDAYRRLVQQLHPDVNPSDTAKEEFIIITQAKDAALKGKPTMPFNATSSPATSPKGQRQLSPAPGYLPSSSPSIASRLQLSPLTPERASSPADPPLKYRSFLERLPYKAELAPRPSALAIVEPEPELEESQLSALEEPVFEAEDEANKTCKLIGQLNLLCTIAPAINNQLRKSAHVNPAKFAQSDPSDLCQAVKNMREFCRVKGYTYESEHVGRTKGRDLLTKERLKERLGEAGGLLAKHYKKSIPAKKVQQLASNKATQDLIYDLVIKAIASTPTTSPGKPLLSQRLKPLQQEISLLKDLLDLNLLEDINAPYPEFGSLLSYAVAQNNLAIVRLLVERGADPNQVDFNGKRPIEYALESPAANPAIINYLVDKMRAKYRMNRALRMAHERMAVPAMRERFIEALDREFAP